MLSRFRYRFTPRMRVLAVGALAAVTVLGISLGSAQLTSHPAKAQATASTFGKDFCRIHSLMCADPNALDQQDASYYIGHDEPAALFYSNTAGAGNNNVYQLTLPSDPKDQPSQDGSGTTWNFQLHPAFWFGMAMCDDTSAPNPVDPNPLAGTPQHVPCTPDSDRNIFTSTDPSSPTFIRQHPGGAFMELQFYPPGWAPWPAGASCDATQWCAALNIDSFSRNSNEGRNLNTTCQAQIGGREYVNFAFLTKSGVAQAPANPLALTSDPLQVGHTPDPIKDLFMHSGDHLVVSLHDTPAGFQTIVEDTTSGQTGLMTASAANGFGKIVFAPAPSTQCTEFNDAFHPMYSTSSENTFLTWTAHVFNVAFSDEIGHFEYCNATDGAIGGNCVAAGATDTATGLDDDDNACFNASQSTRVPIVGCQGTDDDFDGPEYANTWPGTGSNFGQDEKFHPTPIQFTSPLTNGVNFDRVAFETDLPSIEAAFGTGCSVLTGAGCTDPPPGVQFYPFFSTGTALTGPKQQCVWELGGPNIKDATNNFGGSSTTAFGGILPSLAVTRAAVLTVFEDFRRVVPNSCPA